MNPEPNSNAKPVMLIYLFAVVAVVGIYWYYSKQSNEMLAQALGGMPHENVKGPRVGGSNGTSATHSPQHEGVTTVLFPKAPPPEDAA